MKKLTKSMVLNMKNRHTDMKRVATLYSVVE
jgi:hypothetical protein